MRETAFQKPQDRSVTNSGTQLSGTPFQTPVTSHLPHHDQCVRVESHDFHLNLPLFAHLLQVDLCPP